MRAHARKPRPQQGKNSTLGRKNTTYYFSTTLHTKTTTRAHLNDSKCHIHSVLCLGQAAPQADGVQRLKTRYYLNETSIPLLSIILNNEDFTPSDPISGVPSVSICSIGQINKYSSDQVICLMLLTETDSNDHVGVAPGHYRLPLRPAV